MTMPKTAAVAVFLALTAAAAASAQNSFGGTVQPVTDPSQQPAGQVTTDASGFGPIPGVDDTQQPVPQPPPDAAANPELVDYGVPPTADLHPGAPHGPTPASIPGGQVITTVGVKSLIGGQAGPFLMLDILGGPDGLPGAIRAVPASQPGSFQDQVQGQFGQFLQSATKGSQDMPIVLYCLSTECWMSYNAALRAINLGYKNVLWYRGGIEAWQTNGGQLTPLP